MMKNVAFSILILGLFAGALFAISGASTSGIGQTRWDQSVTAGSAPTVGGNITSVNVASTRLTTKWADFYGNVTGTIRLSDTQAGDAVYVWTYSPATGGEVCVSTNTSLAFASLTNATHAAIDANFSTTGDPDDSDSTFTDAAGCPSMTIASQAVTGFLSATNQGSGSDFQTCAMSSGGLAAANHAFCTAIDNSGQNYLGDAANYEIIVPTGDPTGVTYYFYVELD